MNFTMEGCYIVRLTRMFGQVPIISETPKRLDTMFDNQQQMVSMVDVYLTLTQLACMLACKTVPGRASDCLRLKQHGQAQGGLDLFTESVPENRTCEQAGIPPVRACMYAYAHACTDTGMHACRCTVRQRVFSSWKTVGSSQSGLTMRSICVRAK